MSDFVATESAILQLHARMVDAAWRKDAAAFAGCFTDDGEWKIAGLHMRGRDEIAATFARLLGACERVMILAGTPLLTIAPDGVSSRTHMTEFAKMLDGSAAMTLGIYYDLYAETAEGWRFRWRHFGLQYRGPADLSASFVDAPDYGPPPGMPGADEPTVTRRVL